MALLSDAERRECWVRLMAMFPPGTSIPIDKGALRRCVDAIDSVLNSNAGTLNQQTQALEATWNQLPVPVRSQVTTTVMVQRYETGAG